ncbi:unnamed protein product [Acanthoscelides obtectus]|uniref:Platelet-derived growth factor (PDGF) family profile domain-containing protein n=1 Tax=Acanthoscelides obtectus TaxID=200917 RepID=A0A9P0NXR0_ACAOB|nr:unnamed protein product [Acanthoscelides obtectus]CAK1673573.1 hypothetical protein AOBTE_LOCUS29387 [Acanthoscelides obtectus]
MTKFMLIFVLMHLTSGSAYRFVCVDEKNNIKRKELCDEGGLLKYTNNVIDIPAGGPKFPYVGRPLGINTITNVIDLSKGRRKRPKYPNKISQPAGLPPITLRGPDDEFDSGFPIYPKYKVDKIDQVSDKKCTRSKIKFFSLEKRQATCKPRDAIFELVDGENMVSPRYVVLKRCQGMCKNRSCSAIHTANRIIFVTVKTLDGRQLCKHVRVHDDEACGCSCFKTCSDNKKLDEALCKCLCSDKMNLISQCLLKNATSGRHLWNSNDCRCHCIEESICSTGSEWNHDKCACIKSGK